MRTTRIYQKTTLTIQADIQLDAAATHHLIHVLRIPLNAPLILFNGDGYEYSACLSKIEKKQAFVKIESQQFINRESPVDIYLAQGISRGDKMDFTIQKTVELGVKGIIPIITERCGIKLSQERWEKRLSHWQQIIISACEQSGRTQIPELTAPINLIDWMRKIEESHDLMLVLDPQADMRLNQLEKKTQGKIYLLIGPEGGLSSDEIALAKKKQFQGVQLGPRILRTETAALATIAALQQQWGDF